MSYIKKALVWAYGDSFKYIGFMLCAFLAVAFLQFLIVYPIETITAIVLGFIFWTLFVFWSEFK
jgi:hypothetical protein